MAKCVGCGKRGLSLHVNARGLCPDCLEKEMQEKLAAAESEKSRLLEENAKMQAVLTPDARAVIDAKEKLSMLQDEFVRIESESRSKLASIQVKIREADAEIVQKRTTLERLRRDIIAAEDEIAMEQFSLYRPTYNFARSEQYKARLDAIRDQQKQMIKNDTAISANYNWHVNGDYAAGKKMIGNMVKLFLRSFNNECEAAVSDVKFSNFDRCKNRIEKSYDAINKLGVVNGISISPEYLKLKNDELRLAYEYAMKKQEEKEEQAEIRRQQREQAKLEKEIAEARKAAEKEKKHYEQALAALNASILACEDPDQRAELEKKKTQVLDAVDGIDEKLKDIDYRQANQRAGYVYIISNIGAFGEGVYKIGMTRRLDPMERVDELGDASVPFYFDVHAMIFTPDAPALENALHQAFENKRLNMVNRRREYFRVTLDEIKQVVKDNFDKTVEFIDIPPAEQYRESLLMRDKAISAKASM